MTTLKSGHTMFDKDLLAEVWDEPLSKLAKLLLSSAGLSRSPLKTIIQGIILWNT